MTNKKLILKKSVSKTLSKIFITIIFILSIQIIKIYKPNMYIKIKDNIFNRSFNFVKINKISEKILGKDIVYNFDKDISVNNSNNIDINNISDYFEGEKIKVSNNLPIGLIESGIVIYIGNKENFGKTVIIQGVDGYNIWYGNLDNIDQKIYSFLEKNTLIGNASGEYIYLLIEKDGKYFKYDDYVKNKN